MKFHYKAQLAAALIAAAFAGTALAGPVLYTTETTDITSTPGANVAGQVLAGTQVEELERVSGKARVRIRGWSRVADPTHISAEPGKPVIEAAFASSRTVKLDPSAGTAKILGATWNVATAEGWVDSSKDSKCSACHAAPSPSSQTASGWYSIFPQGGKAGDENSQDELVFRYLQNGARK